MDCASPLRQKVKGLTPSRGKFFSFVFLFLFFPIFVNKKYTFCISFHPEPHLLLSRNQHLRSLLPSHNVCLSFSTFEKRGCFNHSRLQFIHTGSTKFENKAYKYWNVRWLVTLEKYIYPSALYLKDLTQSLFQMIFYPLVKFFGLRSTLSVKYTLLLS